MDIAKTEAIAAEGGVVAKNILELAGTADVLLSCLTNEEAVRTLLGIGMQAIAEAVVLGEKVGLDRERLLKVLLERVKSCANAEVRFGDLDAHQQEESDIP